MKIKRSEEPNITGYPANSGIASSRLGNETGVFISPFASHNKTQILIAFCLGLGVLLYVGYLRIFVDRKLSDSYSEDTHIVRTSEPSRAEIQFDFGNGTKRRFEGNIYQGVSVAEAINAAAKAGNISVLWQEQGIFVFDGTVAPEQKAVVVYKNKQLIAGDLNAMPITNNDEIELRAR